MAMSYAERESLHNYNEMLKRAHMCTRCHKQDAYTLGGRSLCAECAKKQRERGKKFRAIHRDDVRARNRKNYLRAKAENRCPTCGRKKDWLDEEVSCYRCRIKDGRRKREKLLSAGVNYPRGENGICWQCNKEPAIRGKKLCQKCYDMASKNLAKGREMLKQQNHLWSQLNVGIYKGGNHART